MAETLNQIPSPYYSEHHSVSPDQREAMPHPEWHMPSRSGGFERVADIERTLLERCTIIPEDENAIAGPVIGFLYDADEFDTHIEVSDEDFNRYDIPLSLTEFLTAHDDERSDRQDEVSRIEHAIESTVVEKTLSDEWWYHPSAISEYADPSYFNSEPTEQLIVGQDGKGVRIFNYAEAMPESRREDCRKIIEVLTQFFGDESYDILQDVVIMPFNNDTVPQVDHGADTQGFILDGSSGVIFLNADLLFQDEPVTHTNLYGEGITPFMEIFVHEFSHLVHKYGKDAQEKLHTFAKKVGWDMDALLQDAPYGWGRTDLAEYAPSDDYIITHDDGTRERVSLLDYYDHYSEDYDDEGKVIREATPHTRLGSPTSYGEKSPYETYADTGTHLMLGNFVTSHYPDARDAWLEDAQERLTSGHDLGSVPLASRPIIVDYRKGDDILYPATQLPDRIFIRALPRKAQQHQV